MKKLILVPLLISLLFGMTVNAEEPVVPQYVSNIGPDYDYDLVSEYAGPYFANFFSKPAPTDGKYHPVMRKSCTDDPYYQYARSQIEANMAMGNKSFQVCLYDGSVMSGYGSGNIISMNDFNCCTYNLFFDILKDHPEYNVNPIDYTYGSNYHIETDFQRPNPLTTYLSTECHYISVLTFTTTPLTEPQLYSLPYFDENGNIISKSLWTTPVEYIRAYQ